MTAPTIGNNSLKPDATKYDAKTEDGEVSCYWHIITLGEHPQGHGGEIVQHEEQACL